MGEHGGRGTIPGSFESVWSGLASKFENVVWSDTLNFLATEAAYTLTMPPGIGALWVNEVGVVCVSLTGTLVTQPTISYGIVGSTAKYKAATITTLLTAVGLRDYYNVMLVDEGETTLACEITVKGAVTHASPIYTGKVYFRGTVRA